MPQFRVGSQGEWGGVCVTQGRNPGGVGWGVYVTQGRIPRGVGWGITACTYIQYTYVHATDHMTYHHQLDSLSWRTMLGVRGKG